MKDDGFQKGFLLSSSRQQRQQRGSVIDDERTTSANIESNVNKETSPSSFRNNTNTTPMETKISIGNETTGTTATKNTTSSSGGFMKGFLNSPQNENEAHEATRKTIKKGSLSSPSLKKPKTSEVSPSCSLVKKEEKKTKTGNKNIGGFKKGFLNSNALPTKNSKNKHIKAKQENQPSKSIQGSNITLLSNEEIGSQIESTDTSIKCGSESNTGRVRKSGFSKGFLINSSKRTKSTATTREVKKENAVATSSDLLEFEDEKSQQQQHTFQESKHQTASSSTTSKPLMFEIVSSSDDNDDPDVEKRPTLSSSGDGSATPLISIIDEEDSPDSSTSSDGKNDKDIHMASLTPQRQGPRKDMGPVTLFEDKEVMETRIQQEAEKEDESFLWKEVSTKTRLIKEQTEVETVASNEQKQQQRIEMETKSSTSPSLLNLGHDPTSGSTSIIAGDLSPSPGVRSSSYIDFQQQLESLMWKNSKNENNKKSRAKVDDAINVLLESVKDWNAIQIKWAWEWILLKSDRNGTHRNQKKKQQEQKNDRKQNLVWTILQNYPTSIAPFLQNASTTSQEDRIVTLQCIGCIQEYCLLNMMKKDDDWACQIQRALLSEWAQVLLPSMIRLLSSSNEDPPRRTVLAQHVCNACICVIVYIFSEVMKLAVPVHDGDELKEQSNQYDEMEAIILPELIVRLEHILTLQMSWRKLQQTHDNHKKAATNQVLIAILQDWLRINESYKHGKISSRIWYNHLFGIEFKTFSTWGSLLDTWGCYTSTAIAEDIIDAISESEKVITCAIKDEKVRSNEIIAWNLVRGVLGSIVTRKISAESLQKSVGPSLRLLSKCTSFQQDLSRLLLVFLGFVWSDSNGLPPDLENESEDSGGLPKSIDSILNALIDNNKNNQEVLHANSNPTFLALCRLVAGCIDAHHDSVTVARTITERLGLGVCSVQILLNLISRFETTSEASDQQGITKSESGREQEQKAQRVYAVKVLIENIPKSAYLRSCIRAESFHGFHSAPVANTIPELLQLLSLTQGKGKEPDDIRSTLLFLLKSILLAQVKLGNIDCLVKEILNMLHTLEEESKDDGVDLVGDLCAKFGDGWRRELLENSEISSNSFGDMLISIGNAMLADPSSLVPLTLFGSIVGVDLDGFFACDDHVRIRILDAVTRLVQFCTDSLEQSNAIQSNDSVFSRLSPLLLLRRIPVAYFEVAYEKCQMKSVIKLEETLSVLATELAARLDIGPNPCVVAEISTEERRLAAEVAGRCLSFGTAKIDFRQSKTSEVATIFGRLCSPSFSNLSLQLALSTAKNPKVVRNIRSARAALYAACIRVPFANGVNCWHFSDNAYVLAACFCLDVVSVDVDHLGNEMADDFLQLQRGCMEFFASCIARSVVTQEDLLDTYPRPLVMDCDKSHRQTDWTQDPSLAALRHIYRNLTSIVRFGGVDEPSFRDGWSKLLGKMANNPVCISVSARVCIWNSFIITAQSMSTNDGTLMAFARSILPWVIEWAKTQAVTNKTQHPLCVAAALQLAFTLITRLRTLDCFASGDAKGLSTKMAVRDAHSWALDAAKDNSSLPDNSAGSALRLAGLKLLLAIITIDSSLSEETMVPPYLSPNEVGNSVTLVHAISNMDPNPDVRSLANRILGFRT